MFSSGNFLINLLQGHNACSTIQSKNQILFTTQPIVPLFTTLCVVQRSCKVPDYIKKTTDVAVAFLVLYDGTPSSAYKKTTALLLLFVPLGQNLVFKALFGSVSDDKYFFAVIFKKDHHPFYRVMVLSCLVHLISFW